MCGIVGYIGQKQAAPVLLSSLSRLEYRGYDSAGIAVENEHGIDVVKAKGRLRVLADKVDGGASMPGFCGIAHTRWATHGEPSEVNAHPHVAERVTGVHNGIIENYQELREKLQHHGYTFYSQTDTEVAIKLVDYYLKKYQLGPVDAINRTMLRVHGAYALALMFNDYPGQIWVARKDSPLIIGLGQDEGFIASDVPAILPYTRNVYYIGNLELACVKGGSVVFYNLDGEEIQKELVEIKWDAEAAEKGGYEHFMLKEIHEQPRAVRDTINAVVKEDRVCIEGLTEDLMKRIRQVFIVACGSAYHVGVVGQYMIEQLSRVPVRTEVASEFRYRDPILTKDDLVIIVSQSGETADSLAALRLAKEQGVHTLAVVNVVGSSIAREADTVLYTLAGPEIAVATTKAYSTQLVAMYAIAMELGLTRGVMTQERYDELLADMRSLPEKIQRLLDDKERLQWFAAKFASARDIFFIGRGLDYGISLEGSLKMKEISYIHSEAYAAGELKHGTISLLEKGTLVIGSITVPGLYAKTMSNMVECRSRGAYLMALTVNGNYSVEDTADFTVYIPKTFFTPSLAVVPLQLMGYYVSVARGLDVDKPRNLAKSVTVE